MSVKSQVQNAEEALRQALINALAEGDEEFLSELFTEYQNVSNLNKKVNDTNEYNYNFNLNSAYLGKPGGDLDAIDNMITFPIGNHIPGSLGDDVISFGGDVVINTQSAGDGTISFN